LKFICPGGHNKHERFIAEYAEKKYILSVQNNFPKQAHRFRSGLFNLPDIALGTKVAGIASYFNIFLLLDRAKMA